MISSRPPHDLYETDDIDAPDAVKDRNGEVVLGLCRRCGKGESELAEPCAAAPSPQGREGRAIAEIAAERRRQIEAEGWTPAHDDKHRQGELAHAAACYALAPRSWGLPMKPVTEADIAGFVNRIWPWWNEYDDGGRIYSRTKAWWKPKDRRRDLIRAGALIAAEIDRLDRLAAPHGTEEGR